MPGAELTSCASATAIMIDGDAVPVRLPAWDEIVPDCPSASAFGIRIFVPHCGQMPFRPAKNSLTWSLCPLGHVKRIPIDYQMPE